MIYNNQRCALGEGPLWHPERGELLWFDIVNKRLLTQSDTHAFDEHVSAAGWIDANRILLASETGLWDYNLSTQQKRNVAVLEADNRVTRSNDGRADPWGGFWIGTMGKNAEPDAGSIYRFFKGELRQLYTPITISNSICFSPDAQWAYFSDTAKNTVWRQLLDEDGWPVGTPDTYLELGDQNPDGAVVDADGNMWLALWGASRVSCFNPKGERLFSVPFSASQITCPAFGGDDLATLFVTSASIGKDPEGHSGEQDAGRVFSHSTDVTGQQEHQVIL